LLDGDPLLWKFLRQTKAARSRAASALRPSDARGSNARRPVSGMARGLLSRILPSQHAVRENRMLRWLGPRIHHPRLWHVNRRGIALGLAIGLFMGFIIPLAQIPIAAAIAFALRANLPVAVASTLVSNPFTFAPIYFLAYRIGAALTGQNDIPITDETLEVEFNTVAQWLARWWSKLVELGKPLVIGLTVMATAAAFLGYWTVTLLWRVHVCYQLWQRRRRRLVR
jgi:hypothetical protein